MANLVELSNQLEDFPEQQLVQMSQDPNSMYPSYLVLSEIQRRNQMRKMYEAQQPKPETTVAEEVIGEFAGQQGLQGAMAQSLGPQDAFPLSDMGNMAPPSPMQAMASGGLTGYDEGGKTKFPLLEAKSKVTKEQNKQILNKIADARLEKFGVAGKMSNLGDRAFSIMGGSGNNIRLNPTEEKLYIQLANEMIDKKASGGRTGYNLGGSLGLGGDSLSQTFINPIENQLSNEELQQILEARKDFPRNEDGSIDKSAVAKAVASGLITATAAAALIIPEPTTSALGAARLGTTAFGRNLLQLPGKIKSGAQSYMGKRKLDKAGSSSLTADMNPATVQMVGQKAIKDLKIPTRGAGLVGLSVAGNMINDGVEEPTIEPTIDPNTTNTTDITAKEIVSDDVETGRRGLANFLPNADPTALIGLGGAIMGANTIGELGKGISEVALGERARKDALQMTGLKSRLMKAQAAKYEADVANMPLNAVLTSLATAEKQLKSFVDAGNVEAATEQELYIKALNARALELQDIEPLLGGQVYDLAKQKISGGN